MILLLFKETNLIFDLPVRLGVHSVYFVCILPSIYCG